MKVLRLPRDPGPAGWNALLPEPAPANPQQGVEHADWLIVGAGFAGLAAARRLSQLDPAGKITVLEASRIAAGPAGRNSGFMIDLPHDLASGGYAGAAARDRAQIAANRHAIAFAADMAREYGLTGEAFAQSGKINAAASSRGLAHNAEYGAHLDALGEPYEMYDAAQMAEITGSAYYQGGLFTHGTAMIQPALFVRGVARGLGSNRVTIHEDSPVTALERAANWIAKTPLGQVEAPNVILAVNGHLQSFGHYGGRLMHSFTYASMTRPLTEDEVATLGRARTWGATPADPMGTTVRRISGAGGDRIVIRNTFTFDPSMEVSDRRMTQICMRHDRAFAARFPSLEAVDMQYRWGGRLCLARNDASVVEELEPGLFAACCQNGLGTARGTLGGIQAAELAAGIAPEIPIEDARPNRLPPLTGVAAPLYLKWMDWKAGAEK